MATIENPPARDAVTDDVRERYAATARALLVRDPVPGDVAGACCGPTGDTAWGESLYAAADRDQLPEAAVLASLGCGNPTAVAELRAGETVLDLGSGGGIDVLLSATRVGPTGFVYGLDMTDEMLELARRNAADAGATNVEFRKGRIESIPLGDASVDVVISNCVVNLSADKAAVLAEVARVLRPGGRLGISDVVADDTLTPGRSRRARQLRRLHRRRPVVRRISRRSRGGRPDGHLGHPDPCGRRRPARRHRRRRSSPRAGRSPRCDRSTSRAQRPQRCPSSRRAPAAGAGCCA